MSSFQSKHRMRSILSRTFWVSCLLLPSTAFAYVDPGSGSVIVTTILGFIAAIGYTFRKFFYNMKRRFSGQKDSDDTEENSDKNNAS